MIDFKVQPEHGEAFEVKADSRDIYVWEKAGRGRSMAKLLSDLHMTELYQVAHIAARRQQLFMGSLDEFAECVLHFETDDDEGEDADPTRPGP
jgi:hypothetical protein